jgi:hypothetical protein
MWSAQRIPTAVNLVFLDRSRYFSIQVASQLSPRGWVDPVPDPLLLRKFGSAGNRTRGFWICSQELSLLDHRGGHWCLSWAILINSAYPTSLLKINFNIIFLSTSWASKWFHTTIFPYENCIHISHFYHSYYVPHLFHSPSNDVYMYVCIRGEPEIRPLHRDLQWSIVLPLLINHLLILHFEWNVEFYFPSNDNFNNIGEGYKLSPFNSRWAFISLFRLKDCPPIFISVVQHFFFCLFGKSQLLGSVLEESILKKWLCYLFLLSSILSSKADICNILLICPLSLCTETCLEKRISDV